MPSPADWSPPTRRDRLQREKTARDGREAARRARRQAKGLADLPPADGPIDPDQMAEPDVDVASRLACPGVPGRYCRSVVSPLVARDVTTWPVEVTGGAAELCPACCEFLFRTGLLDPAQALELQGAPAAYVTWYAAKWDADPARPRRGARRG